MQNSVDQSSILLELQKKTLENDENDNFERSDSNIDQIADNNETGSFGGLAEVFTVMSPSN